MIKKNKFKRVIILGSNSFIAKSVISYLKLKKVHIIQISRKQINFYKKGLLIHAIAVNAKTPATNFSS